MAGPVRLHAFDGRSGVAALRGVPVAPAQDCPGRNTTSYDCHMTSGEIIQHRRRSDDIYHRSVAWTSRADQIDREGPDLLYQQVAGDIAAMVKTGELPPGSRLPAEHELMQVYAVSRPTVRSAVAALREAGVVTVVRGRGTYVKR
jgi:GntR family transcriptional regulator